MPVIYNSSITSPTLSPRRFTPRTQSGQLHSHASRPSSSAGRTQPPPSVLNASTTRSILASPMPKGGCGSNSSASFRYDYCVLRYSDMPFMGLLQENMVVTISYRTNTSDNPDFENRVRNLMEKLLPEAAAAETRFATSVANKSGFETDIYGMAWCTMDLLNDDCLQCLKRAVPKLQTDRNRSTVAKVSCVVRFSTFPFLQLPLQAAQDPDAPGSDFVGNKTDLGGKDELEDETNGRVKMSRRITIIVSFSGFLVFVIFFGIIIIVRRVSRRPQTPILFTSTEPYKSSWHAEDEMMQGIQTLLIDLDVIRTATENFSKGKKLGEGGFGEVYKGTLEDGREIAVKRLSRTSRQGLKQLSNEVAFMAKLQHRNLVKLLGCCLQDEEKLLVYEYLPNTSLDKYLTDPLRRTQLDWGTRYKIIEGIGRGLLYLHQDSVVRVVHRDLKASNILLDVHMNPKILDFGIAKLFNNDETRGLTSDVAGTFGYMSPEYALHGNYSPKSDVYSYGVLVLEIIAGRSNGSNTGTALDLLSHVWHCWNQEMALQVVDECLGDRYPVEEALRCIQIGLLCIQEDPALRPDMSTLVAMLSKQSVILSDPLMPTFLSQIQV